MNELTRDYRNLWRQTLIRLLLTYLAPLLLLVAFFHYQYRDLRHESRLRHLQSIAENQANTLDLFLQERLVNLTNLVNDPALEAPPSEAVTDQKLARLKRESASFVDLGFFDSEGAMSSYAGPYPSLLGRSYGDEEWFSRLARSDRRFVITDRYLGFRQTPHFTIALRRSTDGGPFAVRATLDPEKIAAYITTLRGAGEVHSVLVSASGSYQTATLPPILANSPEVLVPAHQPALGVGTLEVGESVRADYAYSWLSLTDWALLVLNGAPEDESILTSFDASALAISTAVVLAVLSSIFIRTGKVVRQHKRQDQAQKKLSGQLRHAARLASVGELAAGVAHEINNPLAIIAEEAGLLRDLTSPEFRDHLEEGEMDEHLDAIHDAVFRARDITRKLLSFVRNDDVRLTKVDLNELTEALLEGMLERELAVSNIEIERCYADGLPEILVDRGQIEQVLLNLFTNAVDAMPRGGSLSISTSSTVGTVSVAVSDTGTGMTPEQMAKIFTPFFTTKEVGKGTGLGLSVSSGIVEGHGGEITVTSTLGLGSTFTVILPKEPAMAVAQVAG